MTIAITAIIFTLILIISRLLNRLSAMLDADDRGAEAKEEWWGQVYKHHSG